MTTFWLYIYWLLLDFLFFYKFFEIFVIIYLQRSKHLMKVHATSWFNSKKRKKRTFHVGYLPVETSGLLEQENNVCHFLIWLSNRGKFIILHSCSLPALWLCTDICVIIFMTQVMYTFTIFVFIIIIACTSVKNNKL